MHRKLWWLFACLWCAVAGVASAQAQEVSGQSRQLWQLLEYVAVDYGGAVQDGRIADAGEYAEMLDFSASAQRQILELPERPGRTELAGRIDQLRAAIDHKAAADTVALQGRVDLVDGQVAFAITQGGLKGEPGGQLAGYGDGFRVVANDVG